MNSEHQISQTQQKRRIKSSLFYPLQWGTIIVAIIKLAKDLLFKKSFLKVDMDLFHLSIFYSSLLAVVSACYLQSRLNKDQLKREYSNVSAPCVYRIMCPSTFYYASQPHHHKPAHKNKRERGSQRAIHKSHVGISSRRHKHQNITCSNSNIAYIRKHFYKPCVCLVCGVCVHY